MDMKRRGILVIFAISAFFLLSCAAETPVNQDSWRGDIASVSRADLKYENVIFRKFTASPTLENPEAPLDESQAAMVSYLQSKDLFKKVEELASGKSYRASLLVEATLTELKIPSDAHAGSGGIFSRNPHIKVSVRITDLNTGSWIAEQELSRETNTAQPSSSAGISNDGLPRQLGILIGDFVISRARK
ncbi:MAG: hypothetical protein V1736_04280 [Pseudomonadota bacterium]